MLHETVEEIGDEDDPRRILENMTNIPGLARFDWANGFWEDTDITVVVEGDELHLEFVGSAAADWTLTATYRAQWIEVSGQQQHDGADFGVITFPVLPDYSRILRWLRITQALRSTRW